MDQIIIDNKGHCKDGLECSYHVLIMRMMMMISKGTLKNYFNGILLKVMGAKEASGYGDTGFASDNIADIAQEDNVGSDN